MELRKRQWKSWRLFDDMRFGHQRRSPVSGGPWKNKKVSTVKDEEDRTVRFERRLVVKGCV